MAEIADDLARAVPLVRTSVLPPDAQPTAELRAYHPSPSERVRSAAQDALIGIGANPYNAGKLADILTNIVQISPLGVPLSAADYAHYRDTGDNANAAIAAVGAIPGAGKVASKAAKAGARTAGDVAAEASRLFDTSRLSEVPNVKQFDLPRYQPARGVPARTQELIENADVRAKMLDTIKRGQEMGGAKWYNAEPLREAFNAELGKGGDEAFRQYMDMVAATSPRSDVGTNVRNASYYYTLARQGQPIPAIGTPNPQPYGHMAQRLHQQNAGNVVGAGWNPLQNPKPASFVENLAGNQMPVTVDTHAFRLPAMLAEDPRFLETRYITGKGATPRNIQAELKGGQTSLADALETPAFWQSQPKGKRICGAGAVLQIARRRPRHDACADAGRRVGWWWSRHRARIRQQQGLRRFRRRPRGEDRAGARHHAGRGALANDQGQGTAAVRRRRCRCPVPAQHAK
ncbi:hypothetical protein [Bradyrhizobium sp. USDA 313]|uniref:DUF7178 family protein n=1 Tax=Bradyrhizobium sp. USDA 313 TaxID=3156307 RepID=UPI00351751D0